jgi:two-component system LytT family response regulator
LREAGKVDQPIRAMIVDDEPLAREGIRLRLLGESDFELVGEFGSAEKASASIRSERPDVLFLDIHMPDVNGFELLERTGLDAVPVVVFVTAYDEHALRAFSVRALDYLVKPYDDERFAETLGRVRRRVAELRDGALGRHVRGMIENPAAPARPDAAVDRLPVKMRDSVTFIRTAEIDWLEADRDYVRLHVGGEQHLIRSTLKGVHAKLDPRRFVRIHRSAIVNIDRITALQPFFHGEFILSLSSGEQLKVSRTYRDQLATALGTEL